MNSRFHYYLFSLGLAITILFMGCPPRTQSLRVQGSNWAPLVYNYAGIRVVQVQTQHSPVEVRLVFKGDDSWNSGSSPLLNQLGLANALRGGTIEHLPGDFAKQIDQEKAILSYGLGDGYGWLSLSCLEGRLKPAWELFQQATLEPGFDPETYRSEVRELDQRSELERKLSTWGLAQLVQSKGFGPLPFRSGTVLAEGIAVPTVDEVKQWYENTLLNKSQLALVVTGPVDAELVADLLLGGLSTIHSQSWEGEVVVKSAPPAPGIYLEKSQEDQEAIALHLPLVGDKNEGYSQIPLEEGAFMLFVQILEERLNRLFSTDPQAKRNIRLGLFRGSRPGGWLMLDGLQVMPRAELIMSELRNFYRDGLVDGELELARGMVVNNQLAHLQSNRRQADLWALEVGQGSLDRWPEVVNALQQVSEKVVLQMGRSSLESLSWFYYGVPSRLDRNSLSRLY